MGLSEYIQKVIENNRERILNEVPVKDLLYDFRALKIITSENVEVLKRIFVKKELCDTFLDILVNREDGDYYKFCELLKRSSATAIKNFGKKLEEDALGNYYEWNI